MGVSRGLTNSPLDCWFWHISGLRAAALRRLASETRLRAQCGAVALFAPSAPEIRKHPRPKPRALFYAGDGGRTHTVSPPTDFESVSSANSNTPAQETILLYLLPAQKSSGQAGVGVFFCRTSCFLGPGRV